MTSSEFLQEIRKLNNEVNNLELDRKRLQDDLYTLHGIQYSTFKVTGGIKKDIADKIGEIEVCINELKNKQFKLMAYKEYARGIIENVSEPVYRSILIGRYLNGYGWSMIASIVNYGREWISRRLHKEALEEFDILYKQVTASHKTF
ncbi:hypothetical protein [Veillonella sp.]|uniref:hypothetical protein n=1 Tax=Veillonella sp. TaxID=1926307 RepID=UPI0025F86AFA|nr:hypothetical protein [Veillonella sp.]